jgi:hypothetical protein
VRACLGSVVTQRVDRLRELIGQQALDLLGAAGEEATLDGLGDALRSADRQEARPCRQTNGLHRIPAHLGRDVDGRTGRRAELVDLARQGGAGR